MKLIMALALMGFAITFCNLPNSNKSRNANNSNSSNNSNSEGTIKDRFVGTWDIVDGPDLGGGPITFNRDSTYSAQKTRQKDSEVLTGGYEIRGDRLYCKGELEDETKDGFKLDGERMSLKQNGDTIYFNKR